MGNCFTKKEKSSGPDLTDINANTRSSRKSMDTSNSRKINLIQMQLENNQKMTSQNLASTGAHQARYANEPSSKSTRANGQNTNNNHTNGNNGGFGYHNQAKSNGNSYAPHAFATDSTTTTATVNLNAGDEQHSSSNFLFENCCVCVLLKIVNLKN
jgi:hypothetical protein